MKCVRGVDWMLSLDFLLTQAFYERGNEWVGTIMRCEVNKCKPQGNVCRGGEGLMENIVQ